MAKLTTLREYAKSVFEPALGISIEDDPIEGPVERVAKACLFSAGTQTVEEQVDDQLLVLTLRVFNPHRRRRSGRTTRQSAGAALEEVGELIQTTWREHVQKGGVWFSWVTTVEFDLARHMLEAQIVARSENPSILPG